MKFQKLNCKDVQAIETCLLSHPKNFKRKYPDPLWIVKYRWDGGVVKHTRQYSEPFKFLKCIHELEIHHEIEIYEKRG